MRAEDRRYGKVQPIPRGKKELFLRWGVFDEIEEAIDQQYEISYEYDTYGPDLQMHATAASAYSPFICFRTAAGIC